MLALDLNLASRPFKNNTLLWAGYASGLVLLAGLSVWNVFSWWDHARQLDELRQTVGSIEGQMESLDQRERRARQGIAGFDVKALGIQAFKANEVIAWRVFSWTRLFNLMEQIQPNDVRMSSIRPLFRAGRRAEELGTEGVTAEQAVPVSVQGLAKNYNAFLELQQALLASGQIDGVFPERMHHADSGEVLFDLTFIYKPHQAPSHPVEGETVQAAAAPAEDGEQALVEDEPAAAPADEAEEGGPAPGGPAVPAVVEPGIQAGDAQAEPETAAEVKTELIDDADPQGAQPRPFVKGRPRAKAQRGERP